MTGSCSSSPLGLLLSCLFCTLIVGVLGKNEELYTINTQKLKSYAVSNDVQPILESSSKFHKTVTIGLDSVSTGKPLSMNDWMSYDGLTKIIKDERDFIPEWVASAKTNSTVSWAAPCFRKNVATLTLHGSAEKPTLTLTIDASDPVSYLCSDWYFIASRENFYVKAIVLHGKNTLSTSSFQNGELQSIQKEGLHIFNFKDGVLGTIIDSYHAIRVLYGVYFLEDKIDFFTRYMNLPFKKRPVKEITLQPEQIESGGLLATVTLSGLDAILMYGTGSRVGHIAMALHIDGVLYAVESINSGIKKTEWKEWMNQQRAEGCTVIYSPLADEYKAQFDERKAVEFFKKMDGSPYGYENIAYAWIDTVAENFPTPMKYQLLPAALTLFEKIIPNWIDLLFIRGMEQRLSHYYNQQGVNCTTLECILPYFDKLNVTAGQALTLPELDTFTYPVGRKPMVCSVFALNLLRAAGLLQNVSINASEFTPKDFYQMGIWKTNWNRPAECQVDDFPYCQILGDWYWPVPLFSSIKPYERMNEKCGAVPMEYARLPAQC